MGGVAETFPSIVGGPVMYLSLETHVSDFTRGLVALRDVVYFISVAVLALVVAFRALERRKWT